MSIQVSLNGLSFCVKNTSSGQVEWIFSTVFDKKETPSRILEKLEETLNSKPVEDLHFDTVTLIHRNELSTLVPKKFFKEQYLADYLKFNAKILRSDYISFDYIDSHECVNVYVPLMNINNFLVEKFGEITYKHSSTVLIETLNNFKAEDKKPVIYINVSELTFEMLVIENNNINYYNTFEIATTEDFIYYILFAIEQLGLDVEKTPLRFIGGVKRDDPKFEIVYKYVRDVDILENDYNFKKDAIVDDISIQSHFLLLNSF